MDWRAWAQLALASAAGGLLIFWVVGGYYHVRYYRLRAHEPERWKCQPARFPRPGQQREAFLLSCANLTIGGVLTGTYIYAMTHGWDAPIYFDVAAHGWPYTLLSGALLFLLTDGLAYYVHRLLHHRLLFRWIHRWHHRYVAPTPFTVTAMHPVEFVLLQAATFIPLFVLPVHFAAAIAVFVYMLVFNIIEHSGVELTSRLPWQGPTRFHDDHHVHFHCNFGQSLMWWDRMHGTLRRVDRTYGEDVFGGKGAPRAAEADSAPAFVEYGQLTAPPPSRRRASRPASR